MESPTDMACRLNGSGGIAAEAVLMAIGIIEGGGACYRLDTLNKIACIFNLTMSIEKNPVQLGRMLRAIAEKIDVDLKDEMLNGSKMSEGDATHEANMNSFSI